MKKQLHLLKSRIFGLLFLLWSAAFFAQTLVNYPLNNNLSPDFGPNASITPANLQYFDPPSTTPITNTQHALGHLDYNNSGDYLQFNFNLPANDDVTLQVTAGTAVFLSTATGNIQIFAQIGTAPEVLLEQQNLAASGFLDADDISFSLPLSNGQNTSIPVKIRIVGNFSKSGLNISYFGINNISLVREITTISVRSTKTPQPPVIAHNSGASVTLDTDFGSLLTNEDFTDKTYRITNTGSRTLNIGSIQLSPGNVGFSILGAVPSSINAGQSATFTVRFAPVNQGLQTAEVVIAGNITPDNPFRFEVKGAGKSCNLTPVPIAQYGFEGAAPSNMAVTQFSGNVKIIGGTTNNTNPNPVGSRLYYANNDNHTNLYSSSSPTRSWYVRGTDTGTTTVEFGPVDLTNQQEVSINFDLAAFGLTQNNNSGVNNSDYVILSVYNPTTSSWSEEIRLNGSNNSTRRKYAFGASGIAEQTYDGNNTPFVISNGTTNYGSFKLNIPASISQLRYRITAYTSRTWSGGWQNYNLWLIDNVHVDAGNAKFKTWTGTGWTGENTNRPTSREKAVFNGPYNFSGAEATDLTVCECEITSGTNVTIPTNRALTVRSKIMNLGDGNNFVVASDGNLLQINDAAVNSGNITVKRDAHKMKYLEYTYWASPVSGQTFKSFSPTTPDARFYQYNESNDLFESIQNPSTNVFGNNKSGTFESAAKGYAIRYYGTSNLFTGTFKGVPNNGDITFPLKFKSGATGQGYGYNMVGNPYPSNIDFYKLHAANSGLIYNTAYFWTNINPNGAMQGSNYPNGGLVNNYAVLNGTGGVPATGAAGSSATPNEFIKVGQGFIVKAKAAGDLQFTNGDGTTGIRTANSTGYFFNNRGTTVDRFWLELKTPLDVVTTQLIGYLPAATYGFERDYDSPLLTLGADAFYSSLETYKLAIQGRGIFTATDIVPLGTSHYAAGNYTIILKEREGIFAGGQNIYLKDKQTGTVTNLTEGSYTFAANKGENTGRFEIVYEPQVVLATDSAQTDDLIVYKNQGDFVVSSQKKDIDHLEVYDAGGRLIYAAKPNKRETVINAEYLVEGVYVLKITRNGEVSVKKIVK